MKKIAANRNYRLIKTARTYADWNTDAGWDRVCRAAGKHGGVYYIEDNGDRYWVESDCSYYKYDEVQSAGQATDGGAYKAVFNLGWEG